MRLNYFELLQKSEINASRELEKLNQMLAENFWCREVGYNLSLRDYISWHFKSYMNRLNMTTFEELFDTMNRLTARNDVSSRYFSFSEMYIDLFSILPKYGYDILRQQAKHMIDQIKYVVDKLQHELIKVDNHFIIVEHNPFANETAQVASEFASINEALSILEYNHYANKGNITRKKEILIKIAAMLEPWRSELDSNEELKGVLKLHNKKILAIDKLFDMYNKMNIRHNNDQQKLDGLSEQEIEVWYDKIYTMSLFVILGKDVSQILRDFKSFELE